MERKKIICRNETCEMINLIPQMITLRQEEKLIDRLKSLSEIELQGVIDELVNHICKNNMEHILTSAFYSDEIRVLENENEKLQDKCYRLEDKLQEIKNLCS